MGRLRFSKIVFFLLLIPNLAHTWDFKVIHPLNFMTGATRGEMVVSDSMRTWGSALHQEKNMQDVLLFEYKNGEVRPDFSTQGLVRLTLGKKTSVYGMRISNRTLYLTGDVRGKKGNDIWVAAFDLEGNPLLSFGNQGVAQFNLWGNEFVHFMDIDSMGRLVLAGFVKKGQNTDFLLGRLLPNGKPDPEFGENGWIRWDISIQDELYGVTVDNEDHIHAIGSYKPGKSNDCALFSWSPQNPEQIKTISQSNWDDRCSTVTVDEQNSLWLTGYESLSPTASYAPLWKLNWDGAPLQSILPTEVPTGHEIGHALGFVDDAWIMAGETINGPKTKTLWIRECKTTCQTIFTLPNASIEALTVVSSKKVLLTGYENNQAILIEMERL